MKQREIIAAFVALGLFGTDSAEGLEQTAPLRVSTSWPAVVAQRTAAVEDLLALRDIGGFSDGISLSPDRTVVAFQLRQMDVRSNRYRTEWWVLPVLGGNPTRIADGGEISTFVNRFGFSSGAPVPPLAHWSPNSQWFAYLRKSDGEVQIWRSRRDGLVEEQLTRGDADVENFMWAADGSRVLFTLKALRRDRLLAERRARDEGLLWDDDFYPLFGWKPTLPTEGDGAVWIIDTQNKAQRKATNVEEVEFRTRREAIRLVGRPHARTVAKHENGRQLASLEALDAGLQGYRAPLTVVVSDGPDGASPNVCGAPACTGQIQSIGWHPSDDRLYFLRLEGHGESRRAIYEWRVGSRRVRRLYATDDWIADDCAYANDRAVCLYETPTQPRRIVSIDLKAGTQTTLFDPNPEFRAIAFTSIEKLEWQDHYGNDTYGHLVYPRAYRPGQRYPLVIVQYRSGGFLRGGIGDESPIHVLAAHGFFVLSWDRPEFRAIEARFPADDAQRYIYAENREHLSKQSALETLLDSLTEQGVIDPARVGITGLSDGAETTFIGLIHSNRFAAAAVGSPPSDPVNYYLQSARFRAYFSRVLGQQPPSEMRESRAFWDYLSFARNVRKVRAPILMNLSDSEAAMATQGIAALQDAGKPFEAHIYVDQGHIKTRPKTLMSILKRNVDWFNFWLRDIEDPTPEKAEQYTRWRKLRAFKDSSGPDRVGGTSESSH